MVGIPSSCQQPITSDPAFLQARLTLERCIREFQERHGNQPLFSSSPPTRLPMQQTVTTYHCCCNCSPGFNPACCCKCLDQVQPFVVPECLPTQFLVNFLRQMFQTCLQQQPLNLRCCATVPDPNSQFNQQFLQFAASQMNQPNQEQKSNELVQIIPGSGQISLTPNYFQLILDVSNVRPDELSVAVTGRFILVGAERKGRITALIHQEALLRRYELPMTADSDQAQCSLTSDGLLHIAAPWRDH